MRTCLPGAAVLDGVVDEVREGLLNAKGIHGDGDTVAADHEADVVPRRALGEVFAQIVDHSPEVHRVSRKAQLSRLDPAQLREVLDQPLQSQKLPRHDSAQLLLLFLVQVFETLVGLQRRTQPGQWRAHLVREVGDEIPPDLFEPLDLRHVDEKRDGTDLFGCDRQRPHLNLALDHTGSDAEPLHGLRTLEGPIDSLEDSGHADHFAERFADQPSLDSEEVREAPVRQDDVLCTIESKNGFAESVEDLRVERAPAFQHLDSGLELQLPPIDTFWQRPEEREPEVDASATVDPRHHRLDASPKRDQHGEESGAEHDGRPDQNQDQGQSFGGS